MSIKNDIHKAILKIETDYNQWDIEVQMDLLDAIVHTVPNLWKPPPGTLNASPSELAHWKERAKLAEKEAETRKREAEELRQLIGEMEQGDEILQKRDARMRKALCFYAHPDTYVEMPTTSGMIGPIPIENDKGHQAREALVDYS